MTPNAQAAGRPAVEQREQTDGGEHEGEDDAEAAVRAALERFAAGQGARGSFISAPPDRTLSAIRIGQSRRAGFSGCASDSQGVSLGGRARYGRILDTPSVRSAPAQHRRTLDNPRRQLGCVTCPRPRSRRLRPTSGGGGTPSRPSSGPRRGRRRPDGPPPPRTGPCLLRGPAPPRRRGVRSRLLRRILHSTTNLRSRPPWGQRISRSVRRRPSPYSRSMRPPPLTMRCRNACRRSCGPASPVLEAFHPVFRVLAEKRLEGGDQFAQVEAAVGVHVPRRVLDQSRLHRVRELPRHHLGVDRIGDAQRVLAGDQAEVAGVLQVPIRERRLLAPRSAAARPHRRTRSSSSLSASWSKWVSRRRMSASWAARRASAVIGWPRSRPAPLLKQAS